jgi:hypothetical protein
MKKQIVIASCVLMLMASSAAAQSGSGSGSAGSIGRGASGDNQATSSASSQTRTTQKDGVKTTTTVTTEEGQANPKFVRTLTNVQVELTLTDQLGSQTPEKKTVLMIVSSGNWGKVRSEATVFPLGEPPYPVLLNVDARPFVSTEGQVQLEITFVYAPVKGTADAKEISSRQRPSGINQSQTVILQSGKPLVVSQAADPVTDRKVVIEVKATILK